MMFYPTTQNPGVPEHRKFRAFTGADASYPLALKAHSVKIARFFKVGVRQHGAAVSTGATLD
jgi:hypothetical protein